MDQLCFTVRYVLPIGPVERFLSFIPMSGHKGADIAEIIFSFLKKNGIEISDCRGQSYDNASNMSGKYIGTQQIVKERCQYFEYCPCCGHSLNLVDTCTVENCPSSCELFFIIQKIYVFYAASTHRWQKQCEMLRKKENALVVKRVADTRWSARADAVKALVSAYADHIHLLNELAENPDETVECRRDSGGLALHLSKLETSILVVTWGTILERMQETNKMLQKTGLGMNTAVSLLKSLTTFVDNMRERYDEMERKGQGMCENDAFEDEEETRRRRRRTKHFDEINDEDDDDYDQLEPRKKFRVESYLPIIDFLVAAMNRRLEAIQLLCSRFGFLSEILRLSNEELRQFANYLRRCYPDDLEENPIVRNYSICGNDA